MLPGGLWWKMIKIGLKLRKFKELAILIDLKLYIFINTQFTERKFFLIPVGFQIRNNFENDLPSYL